MRWKLTVAAVIFLLTGSFAFVFVPGREAPSIMGMPYIFWSGLLLTAGLVILTYIGTKTFPHRDL